MAVIQRRNRLVSFRLSEQEYEALQNYTVSEGARSMSDFARAVLCDILDGNIVHLGNGALKSKSGQTLEQLVETMSELNKVITRLSGLLETGSNNGNGRYSSTGQQTQ